MLPQIVKKLSTRAANKNPANVQKASLGVGELTASQLTVVSTFFRVGASLDPYAPTNSLGSKCTDALADMLTSEMG